MRSRREVVRDPSANRNDWADEIDDAVRGLASGFLIGIPVVFTVDSWWLGDQTGPMDALVLLAFAYVLTLAAVYWVGFHRGLRRGWQYLADAVEALALAILTLVAVFWTLGQIGDGQPASTTVGRIAVSAAPVSLGVAIANHLLAQGASRVVPDAGDATELRGGRRLTGWRLTIHELAAAAAGALFVSMTIVPVDDLSAIATEVPARNLPLLVLLSLFITHNIVFAAGFAGEERRHEAAGPLQQPVTETVIAYVVALVVAVSVLWLFGRIDAESSPFEVYTKAVLLAFPASAAAAAGRLAV